MTATMTIIMMMEATIIIGLFSLSSTMGFGSTRSITRSGRPSIIFRNNNIVNVNALSSSANDDEDEINDLIETMKTNTGTSTNINTNKDTDTNKDDSKNAIPDISVGDSDDTPDYMSVHDVDWAEMDPLNEIQFDEYESMYLQGKAAAESNDKFNTKKIDQPNCDSSHESVMTEWLDSVPTLNHISVVGRVGSPPDARYFDNPIDGGKPNVVVKMSLALPRYYSAWEREQYGIEYGQEETEWYNLEIWGALAEFTVKNVEKGARIGVVGSIDTDYYPNKDTGLLSTNPKLLVQDIDILESKMEADARRNKNNNSNYGNNNNSNSYGGGGGYGGGNSNPNRNYNNNNNKNNKNNNNYGNGNGGQQQRDQQRGQSFYTANNDDDDDDDDMYDPSRGGGSAGGFFDPM